MRYKEKSPEEKENPPFLYHGSPHEIEELEPRTKPHREKEDGRLIHASQDIAVASMFMAKDVVRTGVMSDGIPYAIIFADREEFIKNDKGGHIYKVRSNSFEPYLGKGMKGYEWITKDTVEHTEALEYDSTLEAMLNYGVQVYFIDKEFYNAMKKHRGPAYDVIKKFGLKSENQKQGINVREFEK